jgi:ribonuclease HI
MTYYGVHNGHIPGIYLTLEATQKATQGFSGALYKSFKHILDAEQFVRYGDAPVAQEQHVAPVSTQQTFTLPVKIISKPSEVSTSTATATPASTANATPTSNATPAFEQLLMKYKNLQSGTSSDMIHIYTDGGTIGNGRKDAIGGYGVFIAGTKEKLISRKLVNDHGKITNNIAELKAIIKALEEILLMDTDKSIVLHYDSTYAADVITGKKNGRANIELVKQGQALLAECKTKQIRLDFEHVYSHTGKQDVHSIGNEIADKLAGIACN